MAATFFFSSRRRHTRCYRDWSSDVYSSDLHHLHMLGRELRDHIGRDRGGIARSEERRVGKECRSRRSPKHEKKKRQSFRYFDKGNMARTGSNKAVADSHTVYVRELPVVVRK